MTDSTDSVKMNKEVTEEDVKQLHQKISGSTTEDVLIASQSESAKLSSSKLNTVTGTYSSKNTKRDSEDVLNGFVDTEIKENVDNILKSPLSDPANTDANDTKVPIMDEESNKIPSDARLPITNNLANVVPDCMLSVLQQKAQNVLKMIALDSELKVPEGPHPNEQGNLSQIPSGNVTDLTSSSILSAVKKSNESANIKTSKTSNQSFSQRQESEKDIIKSKELPIQDKTCETNVCKAENSSKSIVDTPVQDSKSESLTEKSSPDPNEKKESVESSESEQSSRSTEQYTTNYEIKNNSTVGYVRISNERLKNETPNYFKVNSSINPTTGILVQQCAPNGENITINAEMINDLNLNQPNQSASDVIKELSQAITSNEVPAKLSKQGDLINQMFKQKFLTKLQDTGNLDENTAQVANLTAMKFAKWMDDILKEIDTRSKSNHSQEKKKSDKIETKENEEEYISASSSKESISKDDVNKESFDVVKIKEISETDLLEQYGTHLLRDSSFQLFQFVGPDNVPIEVRHLTTVESKKVMIVKKKTSDTQWSNWVVEVGPEVTLDSVSGNVLQKIEKEDTELKMTDKRGWNFAKQFAWEAWMPKFFKSKVVKPNTPILKKQCVMTDADFDIEYPTYPLYDTQYEKLLNTRVNNEMEVTNQVENN